MALDKVLKIYDEQGNSVDYDILASDVKFLPDGKDLPTKLTEMEDAIEDAAESGGYEPPEGGIPKEDLHPSVQTSLGLADTALQAADKTQLQAAISALQTALAGKISGIKANGASETLPVVNGIVELPPAGSTISPATTTPSMDGTANVGSSAKYAREDHVHPRDTSKQDVINDLATIRSGATAGATALQKSDVSVETQGDGTVDINIKDDTYTINLNHTHEGMAKLEIVDEEPSDPAMDTIYALVNDASDPTEIQSLWIAGLEFVGGGGSADDGLPKMVKPKDGSTIQLGENQGSGVSQNITVRAKNLNYGGSTDGLTIEAVGTGLTLSYGQQTGQSSITIPQNNGTVSTEVGVAFSGTGLFNGELRFKQGSTVLAEVTVEVSLPEGITANKAWRDTGNGHGVLENVTGYCITGELRVVSGHQLEICFGFQRSSDSSAPKYGCAANSSANFISSGNASVCYTASTSGVVRTITSVSGIYISCTFLMSELANCYIKDTNANTYIWKGNNVT